MQDGGYRIQYARELYPNLAATDPGWGNGVGEDPIQLFEAAINSNTARSDNDPAVHKLLESRR
jgi:hypothetical protein